MNKKTEDKTPQLSIMVPVYNEEKTILKILRKVTKLPIKNYEVIVVDDASHDISQTIIRDFSKNFKPSNVKLYLYDHTKNRGKGAAIRTALENAKGKYFVIQDADLEYDPIDIPKLLETAIKNDLDAVYGSRFLGSIQNMPKPNFLANKFYNFLLRRLYNTKITDMHTCYKMVRTPLLKDIKLHSDGFEYATELISKLLNRGVSVQEVPISFYGRSKQEGKKIGYKDGIECIVRLFQYKASRIK